MYKAPNGITPKTKTGLDKDEALKFLIKQNTELFKEVDKLKTLTKKLYDIIEQKESPHPFS